MQISAFIILLTSFFGLLLDPQIPFSISTASAQELSSVLSHEFVSPLEFPNLFLPAKYREQPPEKIPESVIARSQDLLNAAIGSLFDRLVLPVVPEGQSKPKLTRYFPYMRDQIHVIDPSARLYANGGVVRSGISYLYDLIYQAYLNNPSITSEEVLNQFIHDPRDLPAIRVRGVGSDFDLLVTSINMTSNKISDVIRKVFPIHLMNLKFRISRRESSLSVRTPIPSSS